MSGKKLRLVSCLLVLMMLFSGASVGAAATKSGVTGSNIGPVFYMLGFVDGQTWVTDHSVLFKIQNPRR